MGFGEWSSWQVFTFIFCVSIAFIIAAALTIGAMITVKINRRRDNKKDE
ncbi:hypothetical protein R0131_02920 [Clostridium sp. AL.422]|nr:MULTISPECIES: hypothetical protein [unclassified Clostridium]MDV4149780.1 hypothetical protein [Clostridium sp. AL.422]